MYKRQVDGCRIADEDFRAVLKETLAYFTEKEIPFYHKLSHQGYLRHLLVRKAVKTGEILLSLVTTSQMEPDLNEWKERLLALPLKEMCIRDRAYPQEVRHRR